MLTQRYESWLEYQELLRQVRDGRPVDMDWKSIDV
jgi:hypothetical protein